jgi:predicted N-formylglutamate amidohydrolase
LKLDRIEPHIDNPNGAAPLLLVVEHASNHIPAPFGDLGLTPEALEDHVAWDIGAHALARQLSRILDAPLIAAPVSRLIVDPNRALDAHDLIPATAEGTPIAGNADLSPEQRSARVAAYHAPFQDAVGKQLAARSVKAIVAVHSFTPILFGKARPWHAGLLHAADARIADILIARLTEEAGLVVGRNEPYAAAEGVFHTMERHATDAHATALIEVRNDLIRDEAGQVAWAKRLAPPLIEALNSLP